MIRDQKTANYLSMRRRLLLDASDSGYPASGTTFDGTNDYMKRGGVLTGIAAAKPFLLTFWINFNGGNGTAQTIFTNTGARVEVMKDASNLVTVILDNDAATNLITMTATNALTDASGWTCVMASIDMATGSSGHLYFGDTAEVSGATGTDDTIGYLRADWSVGAKVNATQKTNACISELFFTDEYLDLSVEANRRKFIDASGKPVDLGSDGSTPTGTQPRVYFPNAFGTFEQNAGSGGDFTVTGALTACASSPSD